MWKIVHCTTKPWNSGAKFQIDCKDKEYSDEEVSSAKSEFGDLFKSLGVKDMDELFKKSKERLENKKK